MQTDGQTSPWRRRRPSASAGVHCRQENGRPRSRPQEFFCIPVDTMWQVLRVPGGAVGAMNADRVLVLVLCA